MELNDYRLRWQTKPSLRLIYNDYFDQILKSCVAGSILEIGGGSGNLKEKAPEIISVDVQPAEWLDGVVDAQSLPYPDDSFDNIVMIDLIHHIEYPVIFFSEASRVIRDKGRLILLEPAITPLSYLIYSLFHEENVDMRANPFETGRPDKNRKPFDSNQGIPTLMFLRNRDQFFERFPGFKLLDFRYYSLFAYPLSGGFKKWSLINQRCIGPLLKIENRMLPLFGKIMAFRMFVILEKQCK